MSQQLVNVLRGCLDSNSVHASTQRLKQLSEGSSFLSQLLELVPGQQSNLLVMVLSTLKNYLTARYNSPEFTIQQEQKNILKNSLLDLFYQIKHNAQAINLYKEIIYIVIAVDYPWPGIEDTLYKDLNGSVVASVYFSRQVVKVNEWFQGDQRRLLQDFTEKYFPRLEALIQQILTNYNEETAKLLDQILKSFYSAFHIQVPLYLRNFQRLDQWLLYFETILNAPPGTLAPSNQQIVSRIYLKFFALYCNEMQDGKNFKGWAQAFRQKYAQRIFETSFAIIVSGKGNEDTIANLINCLHQTIKQECLRCLFTEQHCQTLFYGNCLLPLCQSTQEEIALFSNDEIEYVRRQDDLSCFPVRRSIMDLIEMAAAKLAYNNKSQMIRIVEYSASILSSVTASDSEKEVVIRVLTKIGKQLLKNKYLKAEFENLTVQYFLPLLQCANLLLNVSICELLSLYLPFGNLSNQTVTLLMQLIYGKIVNCPSLVARYNAILAFTALLNHRAALEAAQPHFQNILAIYVEILNTFDHQNLLGCLQSIVKYFSGEIQRFAPDLISHLLRMFCSHCQANKADEQVQDEPDGNSPATAALSTVKQILTCNLKSEVYFNVSKDLIQMLKGIFGQYNNFFDQILSLFNVLVHKATTIADFQYPYLACRKLLQGDNAVLNNSSLPVDVLQQLSKAQKADSEFEESLISILKNLIQKMPEPLLKRFSYPDHQQLLLCLIQNKRILPQEFGNLNTTLVDIVWSPYLTTYSWMIYGVGNLCNPNNLKAIVGVSLYPWLKDGLTPQIIKLIVNSVQEDEDDDDLQEENTAQLLQRYANEDDEQQNEEDSYYASTGVNYSYLYDSPFDSAKDRQMLIARLKSLSQSDALSLMNGLTPKYRKKVQSFFSNN